jgi:peptidyl-prolyl cis-trans isomerase D
MITWMQRHKKWLIITIWISTIAFVGAGFVGWGQYSYGDKAGAIAKVGTVEITQGELQKTYSQMFNRYSQMLQGNFDEEKAKQFGLQQRAFEQLQQQALILNLAKSYDLQVSDAELINELKTQKYFFKDGVFDTNTYKQALSQNRFTTKEYEANLRKDLLIQKTLALLPVKARKNEVNVLNTMLNIADKLNYKVLTQDTITVTTTDDLLKPFWEQRKENFMNEISYDIKFIKQADVNATYNNAKLATYYADNKTHFKSEDGKILPFESAKNAVTQELNAKATKDKALRTYIAFKKGKLGDDVVVNSITLSLSNNPFTPDALEKISKLSLTAPYMKPILVNGVYHTIELTNIHQATPKSFEEAKADITTLYIEEMKRKKLQELANSTVATFNGKTSDFVTVNDVTKFEELESNEATEFLQQLFSSDKKRSYITLSSGKIVLFYVLEQKLLTKSNNDLDTSMMKLKDGIFNEALIKTLEKKYPTEKFIQGL